MSGPSGRGGSPREPRPEVLVELLRKVREATVPSGSPARPLAAPHPAGRAEAILAEIDETVLPRALVFETAAAGRLVVECRERHAIRIADCTAPIEGALSLLATIAAADSPAEVRRDALGSLLAGLCRLPGDLTVQSRPSGLSASIVDKGFAAEEIRRTAAVAGLSADAAAPAQEPQGGASAAPQARPERADAAPPPPARPALGRPDIAALAARSLAEIAAALAVPHASGRTDGRRVSAQTADGAALSAQDFATFARDAAETAAFFEQAVGGGALVYVAADSDAAPGLCFAREGDEIAAAAVSAGDLAAIADAWRAAGPAR